MLIRRKEILQKHYSKFISSKIKEYESTILSKKLNNSKNYINNLNHYEEKNGSVTICNPLRENYIDNSFIQKTKKVAPSFINDSRFGKRNTHNNVVKNLTKIENELNNYESLNTTFARESNNDEIEKLNQLALLNIGARYELLKANDLLIDFNLVSIT